MGFFGRVDSWLNTITGLGTTRDKAAYTEFSRGGRVDDETLQALMDEDDLGATICEAVPEHLLRRGFQVLIPGNQGWQDATNKAIEQIHFTEQLTNALVWERGFGGSVIVLGADDGEDMALPLDRNNVRALLYVNAMDRRDVIPTYWYDDPTKPKYGLPEVYRCQFFFSGPKAPHNASENPNPAKSVMIHESRMLVFRGTRTTLRGRLRMQGWGNSVLSRCFPALSTFNSNWQSVRNILTDASQGIYKVKDLISLIASGDTSALMTRFSLLDQGRSVARAIVVDAENEDFERRDTTLSGLPDLLDRSATRLASAARMPATVLHGISPAGLNATGESDIRNWYDQLEAERTTKVEPRVKDFVELLFRCKEGPTGGVVPENWSIKWPALWQQTDLEKAQVAAAQTQSDVALVQAGVITPEEVALRRAEELGIDAEEREQALESYKAKLATGEGDLTNGLGNPQTNGGLGNGSPQDTTPVGTTGSAQPSGAEVPTENAGAGN